VLVCNITVNNTGDVELANVTVLLQYSTAFTNTGPVACTLTGNLSAAVTGSCQASINVTAAKLGADNSVSLKAGVNATVNVTGDVTATTASVPVPLGVIVAAATSPSPPATFSTGVVVPITVTLTNWGPSAVEGIALRPTSGVLLEAQCLPTVNVSTAAPTTCLGNYTITVADMEGASSAKDLSFNPTVAGATELFAATVKPYPTAYTVSLTRTATIGASVTGCSILSGEHNGRCCSL